MHFYTYHAFFTDDAGRHDRSTARTMYSFTMQVIEGLHCKLKYFFENHGLFPLITGCIIETTRIFVYITRARNARDSPDTPPSFPKRPMLCDAHAFSA